MINYKEISVLSNFNNGVYKSYPFPYIVIENALKEDIYYELSNSFPKYKTIINNNPYEQNSAYRMDAYTSLNNDVIPDIWKEFINYHASYNFFNEVFNIFNKDMFKHYPRLKSCVPQKEHCCIRRADKKPFNLDCQFVINTPTENKSSVVEPHLDNPQEFYAGLFYMRHPDDKSTGGNLCIYEFKNKINNSFFGKLRAKKEDLNLIEEIEYADNKLLLFLNTNRSIHGVSEKNVSTSYRRYINIIGEFPFKIFSV